MSEKRSAAVLVDNWMLTADAQVADLALPPLADVFVSRLQAAGFLVHAADLNTDQAIGRVISLAVDQFSTDRLELAPKLRRTVLGH